MSGTTIRGGSPENEKPPRSGVVLVSYGLASILLGSVDRRLQ